jgi:enolase
MTIKEISIQKILNSAGSWTIEVAIELDGGGKGKFSVPGGLSKGANEVANVDFDTASTNLDDIREYLQSRNFKSQEDFDKYLIEVDGTEDKSDLGGNLMLGLSAAFAAAAANAAGLETYEYIHNIHTPEIPLNNIQFKMPKIMGLIFEGGAHGSGKASIQEFMAVTNSIERLTEIYSAARKHLHSINESTNVGAEGAFSPSGMDNEQLIKTLESLLSADENIALDVAATYIKEKNLEMPDYEKLISGYKIISIEDPCPEDEWTAWENFFRAYRADVTVVADDLTTTNPDILARAIRQQVANGIIIKPNQIGTITETLKAVKLAQLENWNIIVSHRGTDTNDSFVADLAVGIHADFVKFGAPARGERVAKYNRLLEIFNKK